MSPWGWRQGGVDVAGEVGWVAKDTRAWSLREEDTASCGLYKGTRGRQGTSTCGGTPTWSFYCGLLGKLLWKLLGKALALVSPVAFSLVLIKPK